MENMKTQIETLAALRSVLPETVRAWRSGCRVFVKAYTSNELRAVIDTVAATLTDAGREPKRQAIRGYSIGKDEQGNAVACWRIFETTEERINYLHGGDTIPGTT